MTCRSREINVSISVADGQTNERTDEQTEKLYTPHLLLAGYKNAAQNIALMVPSYSWNQIIPWYQFSLKSDQVNILSMAAILKKNG